MLALLIKLSSVNIRSRSGCHLHQSILLCTKHLAGKLLLSPTWVSFKIKKGKNIAKEMVTLIFGVSNKKAYTLKLYLIMLHCMVGRIPGGANFLLYVT